VVHRHRLADLYRHRIVDVAAMSELRRDEALKRYGQPNAMGHITRYSDSSIYDEKCVMCGMTDGSLMWPVKHDIYNTRCPAEEKS
jgi:hypothetical protein